MKKILYYLFVVGVLFLNSENVVAEEQNSFASEKKYDPKTIVYTREAVQAMLKSMDDKIINGLKGKKIPSMFYSSYASMIREVMKSRWLELDSMTAKNWYIDLYNSFVRMAKIKRSLELLARKHKEKTPVYKSMRKKFMAEYKHFKELQVKPTKLTKTRYRELVKAKRAWEKKERIKAAKARALARAKKHRKR